MPISERDAERLNLISPAANDIRLGDIVKSLQDGGGGGPSTVAWADVTGKPATFPPATHTHTAAQISDASAVGRSVLSSADAAAARTAIGAGTSSVVIGTSATQAAAGNHVHAASVITATAIGPGTATNVQGILTRVGCPNCSVRNTVGG